MSIETHALLDADAVEALRDWQAPAGAPPYLAQAPHVVRALRDGAIVYVMARFAHMRNDPRSAWASLDSALGSAVLQSHRDVRGVLIFPDLYPDRGERYEDVVKLVLGPNGENTEPLWVPPMPSAELVAYRNEADAQASHDISDITLMIEAARAFDVAVATGDAEAIQNAKALVLRTFNSLPPAMQQSLGPMLRANGTIA